MVKNYTDKQLLDRVKSLPSFKLIPNGYWMAGVSSLEDNPNKFDDKFYLFKSEEFVMVLQGTTNPGTPILQKGYLKYNKVGAAVVKSNEWYYDVWKYGLHQGKMPALLQLGNTIKVYRDGDNDLKSEEIGNYIEGYYGINFHSNNYDLSTKLKKEDINGWSAGCQVSNDIPKYNQVIQLVKSQPTVSYCLIKEF
jgi:hypothetical protein